MSIYASCCQNCEHEKVCRYSSGARHLEDALNKIPVDTFGENFTAEIKCKYFKMRPNPIGAIRSIADSVSVEVER